MDLTLEQREMMATLEREILAGVTEFLNRTPEQAAADARVAYARYCDEWNALPLRERLQRFAWQHGVPKPDLDAWCEQISDVKWRVVDPPPPGVLIDVHVDVVFRRSIEQVWFTVSIDSPPEPVDG